MRAWAIATGNRRDKKPARDSELKPCSRQEARDAIARIHPDWSEAASWMLKLDAPLEPGERRFFDNYELIIRTTEQPTAAERAGEVGE